LDDEFIFVILFISYTSLHLGYVNAYLSKLQILYINSLRPSVRPSVCLWRTFWGVGEGGAGWSNGFLNEKGEYGNEGRRWSAIEGLSVCCCGVYRWLQQLLLYTEDDWLYSSSKQFCGDQLLVWWSRRSHRGWLIVFLQQAVLRRSTSCVMIKEVTRRVHLRNIWQGAYTAGVVSIGIGPWTLRSSSMWGFQGLLLAHDHEPDHQALSAS